MKNHRDSRLRVYHSVIRMRSCEMEDYRNECAKANDHAKEVELGLNRLSDSITQQEQEIRSLLSNGGEISLHALSQWRDRLLFDDSKLTEHRLAKQHAQHALLEATDKLTRSWLEVRALERVKEKRVRHVRNDQERKTLADLDELYLLQWEGAHE